MRVSVQFYGAQRALTGTQEILVPLSNNQRISDVFLYIRECFPKLKLSEEDILITLNNKISTMDQMLSPKDRIAFLPHIGGG